MKNRAFILLGLLWPALPALAHTGALGDHVHPGFMAGLLHPFTGIDHLAAMLAVGVWSALAVRPVWVAPLAFVALLGAGALGGLAGVAVPGMEPMIAASLLVTGLLIATRAQWPVWAAALVAGLFAFFHGAAHGMELSGVGVAQALAGMLIGSAALHLTGIGLGRWVFDQRRWLSAMAGGAVALLGSAVLLRMAW